MNDKCDYNPCGKRSRFMVQSRLRKSSVFVCGRHLSPEVHDAMTFDDPRYQKRERVTGVIVYELENT